LPPAQIEPEPMPTAPPIETAPPVVPTPQAFMEAVPLFEQNSTQRDRLTQRTVNMLGNPYPNAITMGRIVTDRQSGWTHHNLDGQFTTFTGLVGRVDGSGPEASTLSIIGDGVTLLAMNVDGDTMPGQIEVDVTGVRILRIQIDTPVRFATNIAIANAMIE